MGDISHNQTDRLTAVIETALSGKVVLVSPDTTKWTQQWDIVDRRPSEAERVVAALRTTLCEDPMLAIELGAEAVGWVDWDGIGTSRSSFPEDSRRCFAWPRVAMDTQGTET